MNEFEFTLNFILSDQQTDMEQAVEELAEAGCDDALIGIGQRGRIGLQFNREAPTAIDAISQAISEVKSVLPDARLIEATPDLVGVTDIANILQFSRQNMLKLVNKHHSSFPPPVHEGKAALWHLASVLQWFQTEQRKSIQETLVAVAQATMQLNLVKESKQLNPGYRDRFESLLS